MIHKRHGDINLQQTDKLKGKEVKHNGSIIIGYGEATGHHHRLTVKNPKNLVVRQDGDTWYFELLEDGKLSHEEHKTIPIKKGIYKKIHELEVDHFQNVTRKVID